ncbi:MAG: glycoside hydrolase family 43 protein [Bacteroidota bacterium]
MKKISLLIVSIIFIHQSFAQPKSYTNPILGGFYPDPSICRVGDDYYLVNSSFSYFPGLPLFHSKDLVNWKQIGHAMNRPEQLNLDGAGVSRGLFAPDITYHKGTFYIVCTLIDKLGNFIITAKDPKGPWSNPVALPQVDGIDPSLFFDDNDKAYILFNSIPPDNKSMHDGHRTIRMFELDWKNLKVTGEEKLLINGGTDMAKKPVWIEGPHIFKKDGWYYMICAEGGTGYNHSEVVFRSKSVEGPFISYENNPVLTQRQLDPSRKNPVTTTGHADMIETKDGKWYAVFLGCRPYEGDYYNTGRETFMAPVEWKDGWPVILAGNEEVKYRYPVPMPSLTKTVANSFSGNLTYRDEFSHSSLNDRWIFLRTLRKKWYSLSERKGFLTMQLQPGTCAGKTNPSFIAHRQQNLSCTATTSLSFDPSNDDEKAGLVIFQNEQHFYFICMTFGLTPQSNGPTKMVHLYQSTADSSAMKLIVSQALPNTIKENIRLQVRADKDQYSFYYSYGNKPWQLLADKQDGKFLSTKDAGGFVGSVFALYATSSGKESSKKAYFDWFEYKGNDEVYKQ